MGKKTLDEIHDDTLNLARYRLEFVFRNRGFQKVIDDLEPIQKELTSSTKELMNYIDQHGLERETYATLNPVATDPEELKRIKLRHKRNYDRHTVELYFVVHFLNSFKIRSNINTVSKIIADYHIYQGKSGGHEDYCSINKICGTKVIFSRRFIDREDFERCTQSKVEHITYNQDRTRAEVSYVREMLPTIFMNYANIEWGDGYSDEESFWLSNSASEEEIAQEKTKFEYEWGRYCGETGGFFYTLFCDEDKLDGSSSRLIPRHIKEHKLLEDYGFLTVKIDVRRPKKDLMCQLEGLINYFKTIVLPEDEKTVGRAQLGLYDYYLKVWDLIEQKGQKWTEIAKEVFPQDFIDIAAQVESDYTPNPEAARIKTEQYYSAAYKLIDKGLP